MNLFRFLDQSFELLQLLIRDGVISRESGDQRREGVVEIVADHATKQTTGVVLFRNERIVAICLAESLVPDIALAFQRLHHGERGIIRRLRLWNLANDVLRETLFQLPDYLHNSLLRGSKFLQCHHICSFYGGKDNEFFVIKRKIKYGRFLLFFSEQ